MSKRRRQHKQELSRKPAPQPGGRERRYSLVSLYTGAGGLDYGFEAAGFETRVAVEMDLDCVKTIRRNRSWPVVSRPIETITSKEIAETGGLKPGQVDALIGGPPCQPFSKSAYWVSGDTRRLNDPRARTLYEYMRCVNDLLPTVFLLENVHGISYAGKEEGFALLERMTEEINRRNGTEYRFAWRVLNAADYGVPQSRQRFFLIAHRDGKRFSFPGPSHVAQHTQEAPALFGHAPETHVTAWDAIGALEESHDNLRVRGYWADLLPSIPEGENYLWHTNRKRGMPLFGWRTRYWSFLLKLAKDRPSWTIQAQPGPAIGPFHWANRLLSVREMASIQTFPVDIQFVGARGSAQKQIGNAVPSLLAEVLAREIAEQLLEAPPSSGLNLAVRLNRPIPEPERVRPVPKKYLLHQGNHPDHDPRYLKTKSQEARMSLLEPDAS